MIKYKVPNNTVADANVSVIIPMKDLDKTTQYEVMKDIITGMAKIIDYIIDYYRYSIIHKI